MNVLDLFSGIGGFSLGLERAGMRTVAFCEIEPYCRAVLAKHWPNIPIFPDITKLNGADIGAAVHVICGGFPCQDISVAGKGAGLKGERSGLWLEFARIIGEVRPRYVIVENVSALLSRGFRNVLGDLAALGYDAEWHCIPASAVGAPHRRDRVWIVAYPDCSNRYGRERPLQMGWGQIAGEIADNGEFGRTQWSIEPDVGRVAYGVPSRVDRLKGLGNAIVPQIAEIIGKAIVETENGYLVPRLSCISRC
jgi:DNA (cytosine-5)-methyltransferase 1